MGHEIGLAAGVSVRVSVSVSTGPEADFPVDLAFQRAQVRVGIGTARQVVTRSPIRRVRRRGAAFLRRGASGQIRDGAGAAPGI